MLGYFNRVLHIVVEIEKLSFDTLTNLCYYMINSLIIKVISEEKKYEFEVIKNKRHNS